MISDDKRLEDWLNHANTDIFLTYEGLDDFKEEICEYFKENIEGFNVLYNDVRVHLLEAEYGLVAILNKIKKKRIKT